MKLLYGILSGLALTGCISGTLRIGAPASWSVDTCQASISPYTAFSDKCVYVESYNYSDQHLPVIRREVLGGGGRVQLNPSQSCLRIVASVGQNSGYDNSQRANVEVYAPTGELLYSGEGIAFYSDYNLSAQEALRHAMNHLCARRPSAPP